MALRVLVTGGAGFIGSHLVDALLADGHEVRVLDDLSVGSRGNLAEAEATGRLTFVLGSITDPATVAAAVEGTSHVFHLAVQCVRRSLRLPIESHDVNATGTLLLLEAARAAKVDRFVYCSSSEVYGNASTGRLLEDQTVCQPMTVYGAAKLAGELYTDAYLRTYELPTTVVRPFNAYGPRAYHFGTRAEVLPRFVNRVLNGLPPVIFGDPSNGRDFTYVTELAHGIKLAGFEPGLVGQRVNLAYGRMVTVGEIADRVLAALGRNDLTVAIHGARPGDVHQLHADTAKANRLMGYTANIAFEEGLERYLAWVRRTYPDPKVLIEDTIENWTVPTGSTRLS
ncbi:MAG: GDP-mannose 4,6-dehydratase [Hyphomicrobiaceae bacterium]|nr:GDP-mannose 4,6-dehydratase [Hyphomicrobiaceae bacterium]